MFKLNSKGNTAVVVVLLLLAAGGIGAWYYVNLAQPKDVVVEDEAMVEEDSMMMEDDAMMEDEAMMMEDGTMVSDDYAMELDAETAATVMEKATSSESALTAELTDVTEGTSAGTAYVVREEGNLYHYVSASLPEPAEGSVYEGWLVQQTPELMFFSTGVMELNADGTYSLTYMSEEAYEGYDHVVITEETVVDETPEVHVLEGTVQ